MNTGADDASQPATIIATGSGARMCESYFWLLFVQNNFTAGSSLVPVDDSSRTAPETGSEFWCHEQKFANPIYKICI